MDASREPFSDKSLKAFKKAMMSDEGIRTTLRPDVHFTSPERAADPVYCQRYADIIGQDVVSLGITYHPAK